MNANSEHAAPYDAVFFDMDGTLLPLEVRDFLLPFYDLLEVASARARLDPPRMRDAVNQGIFAMYDHPEDETNEACFWRVFFATYFEGRTPEQRQQERMRFFLADFYAHDFEQAGAGVVPNPAARRVVESLCAKGYPLYLTTMPMFPRVAIEWRLKWADVPVAPFSRITTFDNSTSVKPHLSYYRENLLLAGVDPGRVLMVGNNTSDDMAAQQVGMDVYLVTDYLINPNEFDTSTVKHGTLSAFADWAEKLPACTSTHALGWRERADALRIGREGEG